MGFRVSKEKKIQMVSPQNGDTQGGPRPFPPLATPLLILLMITTALIVRVPAASGYGKIYSYLCQGFRFGLGSLEHNFEGSGLVQVH